ncbi:MAG: D-alanine--D-alanine ligase [Chloroflexota bacterium]|nr:D-alanine--D-alanine ligase [Chloroflexota bacterium]
MRVAVLFGGQSAEHDVSLRSAQTVIGALDPERYEVVPLGVGRDGRWLTGGDPLRQLAAASPLFALGAGETEPPPTDAIASPPGSLPTGLGGEVDVVFPVLHGPMGEDGTVQGLLELSGLPYVGSGVLGSAVAMDKAMAKTVLAQAGLPQVSWRLVQRKEWERDPGLVTEWIADGLGFPCFVKPANMGSSVGVVKAHDAGEFAAAMATAARFDRRVVIEAGVDARELEVAVLGNDEPVASVAGEVVPSNEFYDYEAKYVDDRSKLIVPAELEGKTLVYLQELAIDAFRALDLAGLARVDLFMERPTDHIFVNEVNTLPGFTAISMYPRLWEASGVPLSELVDRLIGLALERHADRRR